MPQQASYSTPRADLGQAIEQFPLDADWYVGDQVLRDTPVKKRSAVIPRITRESITRDRTVNRAVRGAYSRDTYDADEVTYRCTEKGHEQPLGDEERELYSSDFDAELYSSVLPRNVLRREQEKRIAAAIFNTTTFTGATLYTDLGTDWDQAAAGIVADVDATKQIIRMNCGFWPNTMVVSATAIPWFKGNTDIKGRINYVAILTQAQIMGELAALFGIERVLIAGAIKNTADEGQTFVGADIWSSLYCWLGVCARTQAIVEPCVGRTFRWEQDTPEQYTVDSYYESQTRSTIYRARQYTDEKLIDPNFGHLLKIDT